MKKIGKVSNLVSLLFLIFISVAFICFISACDKDNPLESRTVTCSAGCSSMSFGISGESGSVYYEETCTYSYVSYPNYVETCNGTITFETSGNSYNYNVVYNWPACSITVTVEGVGTCSDQVNQANIEDDCDCDKEPAISQIVKYRSE